MREERRRSYGNIRLLEIYSEEPYDWEIKDATHLRVCLPSGYPNMAEMLKRGFFPADRVLDVSVNLVNSHRDFGGLVRTEPQYTTQDRDKVFAVAQKSFPTDRRFHLSPQPNPEISEPVIKAWVDELSGYYLCRHREDVMGFLSLSGEGERRFVHLAAVDEKYRPAGAALSLYAAAARDCKAGGIRLLNGCVSSKNTAVMNLYAFLGASFSNPTDVYLKEVL